ncbi:hypothetical protein HK100_012101 [Physocladia obscura]|uniref:Uncharacterized protein n=1 Tax=Physocladia obscura TaxID=109957 RepID=A0AAD5T970_9FUNG|nr:hypothetical protein HK100_012101 [Physocladia obscura]
MDWVMDVKFDPNDPRNSDVLQMKQLVQMGGSEGLSFHECWSQRKYFRLNIPNRIWEMALGIGIDAKLQTKRLVLMKKRYRKEVSVKAPIPLDDSEISDTLFEKIANPLEDDVGFLI